MKKLISLSIASLLFFIADAQIQEGGIPLTMDSNTDAIYIGQAGVPQIALPAPDIMSLIKQDEMSARNSFTAKPSRIGVLVPCDISFPSSGKFDVLSDGAQIWRTQIRIPDAEAIGLYYDKFHLPQGVKLYLYNETGNQVLGAYSANANSDDSIWANEKVQGELVNIELDIAPGANTSGIVLHVNQAGDFYKAIGYLNRYSFENSLERTTAGSYTYFPYDSSSPCEVNAICSQGDSFPDQRKATIHLEYAIKPYIYGGSGVMMNNTKQDCTPYMLTATHVEQTNSTSSSTFSSWIFYFNYETSTCIYTGSQPKPQTMTGATFKARASYDSASSAIVGDFLLLQLKSSVPNSYGAYLSGWDRSGATPSGTCISFHHPSGDVKKLSTSTKVTPNGNFNGGEANSHWQVIWGVGGTEEGSSGGGLFDPKGRLIGTLSGGGGTPPCTTSNGYGEEMTEEVEYSKFSLNWDYVYEKPSTPATRLRNWLDPDSTGATTLNALSIPCAPAVVQTVAPAFPSVAVFPNPTQGLVNVKVAFPKTTDIKIEVFNIVGERVSEISVSNIQTGEYAIDLSRFEAGVYFVKISTNALTTTKKVILTK